ncbi:MAG TPA: response regulator transcription factor [Bryobacteraceae bacterium]|nr:response regulator transcription factor [Bryobacteraceae bacterium]
MPKNILVVEDDLAMARVLKQGLEQDRYSVTLAHNGWRGLELAQRGECDAIVLDVMLPSLDGFGITRQLRASGNVTPILMLTARDDVSDIVLGLDTGAEDYLTKPFSFQELLARLRSLIRRSAKSAPRFLQVSDLALDPASHAVSRGGVPLSLARSEFVLLELLMRNAGGVVSRDDIAAAVWGSRAEIEENNIDVLVASLRGRIDGSHTDKLIQTVRGSGYKLAPRSLP